MAWSRCKGYQIGIEGNAKVIERDNDPIAGILNGLGMAFILWGFIFITIAVIRWLV